jgi:uncharacterized protein YgbK (DUF1537 family)
MPQILVIADDFTGAAEIGGIAHLFGRSVRIVNKLLPLETYDVNALIVDTNSRRLPAEDASIKIKSLLSGIDLSGVDLVYKKVDSVVRGPVESEIKALMDAAGCKTAVLMPANPSRGRTIQDGKYYIEGVPIDETDFKNDPEYPRSNSDLRRLVMDSTQALHIGDLPVTGASGKIIIPDVVNPDSFKSLIDTLAGTTYLPAGGADFFRSLLQYHLSLSETIQYACHTPRGKRHFIIGSKSQQSNITIDMLAALRYSAFYLPINAVDDHEALEEWLGKMRKALLMGNNIFIARPEKYISDPISIKKITGLLAAAANVLITLCAPDDEVIIEGGETASTIIRGLENPNLKIKEVIADGVVKLQIGQSGMCSIVKPGSYKWSKNFMNTLKHEQ